MDYLHSVPTEQGVLVSLLSLTDGVDQFVERLTRDHFSGKHQIIFDAIHGSMGIFSSIKYARGPA